MTYAVETIGDDARLRARLLALNNEHAEQTSLLTGEKFDRMVGVARVATRVGEDAAFLLGFDRGDAYDGANFAWFRERFDNFLYVDRVVVGQAHRRLGLGRLLYEDLFRRAAREGQAAIACEVNMSPPNPVSDAFHAALGFSEVGTAIMAGKARTVRYLLRRR